VAQAAPEPPAQHLAAWQPGPRLSGRQQKPEDQRQRRAEQHLVGNPECGHGRAAKALLPNDVWTMHVADADGLKQYTEYFFKDKHAPV
jgi:hypothetical protein